MAVDQICMRGDVHYQDLGLEESKNGKEHVDLCIPQTEVLYAIETQGMNNLQADGVLGLAPESSEMILTDLFKSKQIRKKVFSFSLDMNRFTLGGFDENRFARQGAKIQWIPIIENSNESDQSHWLIDLNAIQVADASFESISGRAIIDTGTSFIRVPNEDFENIKEILGKGRACSAINGHFSCQCGLTESYSNFPKISLEIQNEHYELTPYDYMEKIGF